MSIENFQERQMPAGQEKEQPHRPDFSTSHLIYEACNGNEDINISDKFVHIWQIAQKDPGIKNKLLALTSSPDKLSQTTHDNLDLDDSLFLFLLQKKVKSKLAEFQTQIAQISQDILATDDETVIFTFNHKIKQIFIGATEDSLANNIKFIQSSLDEVKTEYCIFIRGMKDGLTKLWNRQAMDLYLQMIEKQDEEVNEILSYAYIIFDIDHFKQFNDQYGHQGGDVILKTIGQALTEEQILRKTDFACRCGGEEFALLLPIRKTAHLPNLETEENKKQVQTRLQQILEQIKYNINQEIKNNHAQINDEISFSAGIKIGQAHEINTMRLEADKFLYQAKMAGRNKSALNWSADEEQSLVKDIKSPMLV